MRYETLPMVVLVLDAQDLDDVHRLAAIDVRVPVPETTVHGRSTISNTGHSAVGVRPDMSHER